MKSQHEFSNVPSAKIPRSSFNLSHSHKTVLDADYLYPICQPIDVIPGDTFNMKTSFFLRLNTMLRPILDNLRFETFAFYVPYRLLWNNHEKFHGAQTNPGDSIDYTIPVCTGSASTATTGIGSLWDHFGLPVPAAGELDPDDVSVSAMPFLAYTLIWDDWFRDENLQDSYHDVTGWGGDGPWTLQTSVGTNDVNAAPLKRGKRHDYFTSCLPWPQKGTAVSLPLGTTAPVVADAANQAPEFKNSTGDTGLKIGANSSNDVQANSTPGVTPATYEDFWWDDPGLEADLTNATASTINDIRLAFQTQRLLERDARSGTRYVEALKAHWGVTSPDFRLQRPEFLGGGSSVVQLSPVAQQNAQTTPAEDDKLGNLAANGIVHGTHSWTKSFVEHGVVIILGNIRGDITYSQGIDRYWSKSTRYDFFYPVLSGIGEQSVLNKEIWADGSANDDLVFGYQERYAEYRYLNSKLTSLMRPDASGTLASWHLSEDFATLPALGDTFIQANTGVPLDRAIAVPTQPQFFGDFYHEIRAARPMPLYGVPGNLDHF